MASWKTHCFLVIIDSSKMVDTSKCLEWLNGASTYISMVITTSVPGWSHMACTAFWAWLAQKVLRFPITLSHAPAEPLPMRSLSPDIINLGSFVIMAKSIKLLVWKGKPREGKQKQKSILCNSSFGILVTAVKNQHPRFIVIEQRLQHYWINTMHISDTER